MEGEKVKLLEPPPRPPPTTNPISIPPINSSALTSTSTIAASSSSSSSELLRQVQASFKRHRPLCTLQPRRSVAPVREAPQGSILNTEDSTLVKKKTQGEIPLSQRLMECLSQPKKTDFVTLEAQEDASMPPSEYGSTVDAHEENFKSFNSLRDQPRSFTGYRSNITAASSVTECEHILMAEGQKKVHADHTCKSQEMDWDVGNQMEAVTAASQVLRDQNIQNTDVDGNSSLLVNKALGVTDEMHRFRNFIQKDLSHPMTQASVAGSSCTMTTLITSTSAPQPHNSNLVMPEYKPTEQPSHPSENRLAADQPAVAVPSSTVATDAQVKRPNLAQGQKSSIPVKGTSPLEDNSAKECVTDLQSEAPLSKVSSSSVKPLEPSKTEKQDKVLGRKAASSSSKKGYDPDAFFKVNGKLYQRLGKIGSGGSSEVHKVITPDCSIYALKKIKLKGRDYATAYGFCQEIGYLKRLKGKKNIIQLVDYEVTDKNLLDEVLNGSMSNKESRLKQDGYIYMVLEYGEIDLASMLSQKWEELDDSNSTIDENWLRFYWKQILLAVSTIHEERIVHSDLKPANFLLVRGSLKLIDFGIAKAIMNDTTNIQRDSQVGTLSYMSPEAFMCNEADANGNTIKCGRPSDIWSLGCILYQMVYGRTPFSEYKTFWAKFKVITDPNHEITYEPLPNPWLLDLMKKCLAWERNERWRIPELLQHPFLVPPVPPELPAPLDQTPSLLQLIAKSCESDGKVSMLCTQLQNLLVHPRHKALSVCQYHKLLCDITALCLQLQQQLGKM